MLKQYEIKKNGLFDNTDIQSGETFSVPSSGLIIPGIASPKDRWSIR